MCKLSFSKFACEWRYGGVIYGNKILRCGVNVLLTKCNMINSGRNGGYWQNVALCVLWTFLRQ